MFSRFARVACVVLVALAAASTATAQYKNEGAVLGTNLPRIVDYSRVLVFVDLMKQCRAWISQREGVWNTGEEIPVGPNGYPARLREDQWAATLMRYGTEGRYPPGRYAVFWDGEGELAFPSTNFDTVDFRVAGQARTGRAGLLTIDATPADTGILLQIRDTNPDDPMHNVHVVMPGFETSFLTNPFHPSFLESLEPYSVIRFAGWQQIDNSELRRWEDRPTPETWSQAGPYGVALEYMIELCNTIDADPWFCMPHKAEDDFVRRFAQMVEERLEPGLRVFIEYSSDLWRSGLGQHQYATMQGLITWPGVSESEARIRWQARRSTEVFGIWEDVFGGSERLVRVIANAKPDLPRNRQLLEFENTHERVDAFAIPAFFGWDVGDPRRVDAVGFNAAEASVDDVLKWAAKDLEEQRYWTRKNHELAEEFGLQLLAYAGGQDFTPLNAGSWGLWKENPAVVSVLSEANRDPRVRDLYKKLLRDWVEDGGGVFVHYTHIGIPHSKYGNYSVRENWDDPVSPKELGFYDFLGKSPPNPSD